MSQDFPTKMKRLFSRSPFKTPPKPSSVSQPPSVAAVSSHTTGLQPKFTVPPLPHPRPHEHLQVLATSDTLLLRPSLKDEAKVSSYVRIEWGKDGSIAEVDEEDAQVDLNWKESVVVYGIVGIINLFSASYLLVVSSRTIIGELFDEQHPVYNVKGVTVIPLEYPRAKAALELLANHNASKRPDYRPSLLPISYINGLRLGGSESAGNSRPDSPTPPGHVKFADDQIPHDRRQGVESPETVDSDVSSLASNLDSDSSDNNGAVAKVLAERLSFWNRLSKRASQPPIMASEMSLTHEEEILQSIMKDGTTTEAVSLENIIGDGKREPAEVRETILSATSPVPKTTEEKHNELEDKIIRETVKEFSRAGMYFAYNFDITRSLQHKQELVAKEKKRNSLLAELNALDDAHQSNPLGDKVDVLAEASPTLPLWRRVDRQFWWNEWLSKPFIDAGLHSFVLPIMQGYYQIASFPVPREPVASEEGDYAIVDYIMISRRSRDRAGLRYQRRGIDDDANVANFVETETIMRVEREGFVNVFSHVQIRGSIPLFWNQPGYSLKPAPVLTTDRTHAQNMDAMKRHFTRTISLYGPHTIVNLAEQAGKEAAVTNAYREYVNELDLKDVKYCEYDFHRETRGMKYENISKLIEQLERTFENQGYLWISNNSMMSQQRGVFRVNCIDCLDRTNVVESAFARYVLNRQLGAVALLTQNETTERTETDVVFNDVWANNGDAISRAYAGTSALKGDFTRTGKRDLTGLLNDGMNSLARMYTSTFGDWFSQAVIDFMLGNRTISVFHEFLVKLQSSDPSELLRISRIRAEAIATSVARVLEDGERLLSGWTLFAPVELNAKAGLPFEEKVLLLSVRALYIISYDYTLEKVKIYTRVPLGDVVGINKGVYILSPLEEGSRDPLQNYGFVISWHTSHQATRVTSYSIRNSLDLSSPPSTPPPPGSPHASPRNSTSSPRRSSYSRVPSSPRSPRSQQPPSRRNTALSLILSKAAAPVGNTETSFAAFKALPVDPARSHRDNGSFVEPADELTGATNCKQAVDIMVDAIHRACIDVGNVQVNFVTEKDVVSLTEAQRMTSMYSKMEYGVKRLLWLGG
ncbi:SacI homology domain-containing protein [Abortiporus biennis]|nr:SacI homology domain-containing protein [Abortiporus biennis]